MAWHGGTHGKPIRKTRVDECARVLEIGDFQSRRLTPDESEPAVFLVEWRGNGARFVRINLVPTWLAERCPLDWQKRVQIDSVPSVVGGARWVFRCSGCDRPCRLLYAPRIGSPFQCRECHDLTYLSAQRWDTYARTGHLPGVLGRMIAAAAAGEDPDKVFLRTRLRYR